MFFVKRRSILYKAVVPFFVLTFLPRVTWNLNFEVPHVESMWVKLDPTSISIGSNLDFFRKKIFGDIFSFPCQRLWQFTVPRTLKGWHSNPFVAKESCLFFAFDLVMQRLSLVMIQRHNKLHTDQGASMCQL